MSDPLPRLIDCHQHLILRGQIGYAWTDDIPALAGRSVTPSDYAALVAGKGVEATLFMETGVDDADYQREARLVSGLIGKRAGDDGPLMLGQIASCRPEGGEAEFATWLEECLGLGVLGFRRILHVMPDELSQSAGFRANVARIGAAGLSFDLCLQARQLDLAEGLARACPDTRFVLDHCGNPDIGADAFAPWAAAMARLARLPNLWVKVSGVAVNALPLHADAALLRPYIAELLELFGPERLLWGGDWPVVEMAQPLPDWIDTTRALIADLSPDEQAAICHGTARHVYRF